nr:hypothetical protein [Paludibacteraceae bacterium]
LFSDISKSFARKMQIPQGFTLFYAAKTGYKRTFAEIKCEKRGKNVYCGHKNSRPGNLGRREGRRKRDDGKLKMENGKLKIRPDGIRHSHQEEPASDAGERKKERKKRRSCGASPLGMSGTGIFGLIQCIICPVPVILCARKKEKKVKNNCRFLGGVSNFRGKWN